MAASNRLYNNLMQSMEQNDGEDRALAGDSDKNQVNESSDAIQDDPIDSYLPQKIITTDHILTPRSVTE